jgi:hypothetical protein
MDMREMSSKDGLRFEGDDKGLDSFAIRKPVSSVSAGKIEESLIRALGQMMAMTDRARQLPNAPDELDLQLGLKLADDDFIITRGQNNADLVVTMKWRSSSSTVTATTRDREMTS